MNDNILKKGTTNHSKTNDKTRYKLIRQRFTLNARHFIQMWQHLKRALEEFAQIKLKSMFLPRGCRVLHLKIRRPSALRLSPLL